MTGARWLLALVAVVALAGCSEVADDGTVEMSNNAPGAVSTFWIAQLRDHCREPSCRCDIGRAADYADARLREVR